MAGKIHSRRRIARLCAGERIHPRCQTLVGANLFAFGRLKPPLHATGEGDAWGHGPYRLWLYQFSRKFRVNYPAGFDHETEHHHRSRARPAQGGTGSVSAGCLPKNCAPRSSRNASISKPSKRHWPCRKDPGLSAVRVWATGTTCMIALRFVEPISSSIMPKIVMPATSKAAPGMRSEAIS